MNQELECQAPETGTLHPAIFSKGVLVVDDSELQRLVSSEILRSLGVSCIYDAANGADALALIRTGEIEPAVMLVDLHMPDLDGIELIQATAKFNPHIAVLIVSGADTMLLETMSSVVRAYKMTMLGALPKPLNGLLLKDRLTRYRPVLPLEPRQPKVFPQAQEIKRAIRLDQIHPHYQPKVSLQHAKVVGFEALARWCEPTTGKRYPCEFIDLAAEYGLLKDLTLNMLDAVLTDMRAWNSLELYPQISLNIAPCLLEDADFANQIIRRVKNANINPKKILFEITENTLMKNQAVALGTIARLKLNGFGFSIDDYGTGFSSMQQLSNIAFSELKIDRTFVSRISESEHLRSIVQCAFDMGQRLGLTTVAEGVETLEELQLLRAMGCDEIQGYIFAPAMPACDVLPWLQDKAAHVAKLCQNQPDIG
jgi:EAL domain-containing protein (putative c-di-GMP-specific phosphodiesterase class I)/ActR/RegA family two-component response regulator